MEAPKPVRYRLYIDESGDHTYNDLSKVSRRYLSILGAWFKQESDYSDFADSLELFKRSIFGARPDDPIILHRKDVINRKGAFGALCQPELAKKFDDGLLQVVASAKCKLVCVTIDKKKHIEKYSDPFHPYHYCVAAMLERYCGWLNYRNAVGDVMAESRGGAENNQLSEAYKRTYASGTYWHDAKLFQRALTSKEIKIKQKIANIAGLQLADVLAYPVREECLTERSWFGLGNGGYGKRLCEAVQDKFNKNYATGKVRGYGKVWL